VAGTQVHVIDQGGLGDPIGGRLIVHERGRPGHEKRLDPIWTVARYGDQGSAARDSVAVARQALACGHLHELIASVTEPLGVGRVLANLRDAADLYSLRIDNNPAVDKHRFCTR
jgi:arabinofuranosyltransferase